MALIEKSRNADGAEEPFSSDPAKIKLAIRALSRGPLPFAFGETKEGKPVLVMAKRGKPKALADQLKKNGGIAKPTWGLASGGEDGLNLDVEGRALPGMRKGVQRYCKDNKIPVKKVRLLENGSEVADDSPGLPPGGGAPSGSASPDPAPRGDSQGIKRVLDAKAALVKVSGMVKQALAAASNGQGDSQKSSAVFTTYLEVATLLRARIDALPEEERAAFDGLYEQAGKGAEKISTMVSAAGPGSGAQASPASADGSNGSLAGPVGHGGRNQPEDVKRVQQALNQNGASLDVDGQCGPKTIKAIIAFQKSRLGGFADGRVDPDGPTWKALRGQPYEMPKPAPRSGSKGGQGGKGVPVGKPPEKKSLPPASPPPPAPEDKTPLPAAPDGGGAGDSSEARLNETVGPYTADYKASADDKGLHVKGGITKDTGSPYIKDEMATVEGDLGEWQTDSGGTRYGVRGSVGAEKGSVDIGKALNDELGVENLDLKIEAGAGTAGFEASAGDDGISLGATANAAEVSVTAGYSGTDHDEGMKLGLSEGVGAGGRLHWGDKDKDGRREYGFGFDYGPVGFDVKTEDPLRTALKMNPVTAPLGTAADLLYDGNMTPDAALDAMDQGADLASKGAKIVADEVKETYQDVAEATGDLVEDAAEAAGEAAEEVGEAVSESVDEAADTIRDAANDVADALPDWLKPG